MRTELEKDCYDLRTTKIYVKQFKLEIMKKLLIVALMLAFTLPSFAQVPTQDTTGKSTNKTMKKKDRKKKDRDTTSTMPQDTTTRDTTTKTW